MAQDQKGPIKELFESGKTKAVYSLDEEGKKHGRYVEYYENGKEKVIASFAHGAPDGAYEEHYDSGKTRVKKRYAKGKIDGDLVRFDERGAPIHRVGFKKDQVFLYTDQVTPAPAFSRTPQEIWKKLDLLDPPEGRKAWPLADRYEDAPVAKPPYKAGKLKAAYLDYSLRYVKCYRALCEVSPDIAVDPGDSDFAQCGAVVTAANGKLSHTPPKPPEMASDFFAKGEKGCGSSNLSFSPGGDFRAAIDGFMSDSDASNLKEVGHRAWLLNPALGKIGLGEAGKEGEAKALWVFDTNPKPPKPPDLICFPARGHVPIEFMPGWLGWSMAPQGASFKIPPANELKVEVWRLDPEYDLAEKLKMDYVGVTQSERGMGKAVVFRPVFTKEEELLEKTFLVSISGNTPPRVAYFVHFFKHAP